jgi:ribosomal protein S18 acetylase RimI-like enzyme
MSWNINLQKIETASLSLDYYLVPWDTEIFQFPVVQLSRLEIHHSDAARADFQVFKDWLQREKVVLCACRLDHDRMQESLFLEEQGFRFIELNYHPVMECLQQVHLDSLQNLEPLTVAPAGPEDAAILEEMAGTVFGKERFHADPRVGAAIANLRYRAWMRNSLQDERHQVLKFSDQRRLVGFFIVEYLADKTCYWHLTAVAPGNHGQGVGKRLWTTMLLRNRDEGIERVETSISSHNIRVMNLYVSLNFRFISPQTTFHWHV